MIKRICLLVFLCLTSCALLKPIPQPEREFRGFWVATVVNIDWPKNANDDIEKQKTDFLHILNFYQNLNFNAAIVQIRTAGDAFYESKYAPWSRFLTGEEGKAPETSENLLKWMIDETHQSGMEFHAWLNPYRATFDLNTEILSPSHDFHCHPEWMRKYGKKYYYDPGLPEVRQRIVKVIEEIVTDYDVDAIHFDDYFYPYTLKNETFQDSLTYYNCALPNQSLGDWRRSNIDSLIKNSRSIIKARKPWVQFGVSPFGVWKNKATDERGSDTKAGQTTYENLYADPLLWMEKGWLDYIVPQVYWSMELPVASHRKIVNWWANNSMNTNLYVGNGPYKIRNNSDKAWDRKKELPTQVTLARKTEDVKGNVFFSAKSLMQKNKDVVKHLKKRYYKSVALPPVSPQAEESFDSKVVVESMVKRNNSILVHLAPLHDAAFIMVYRTRKKLQTDYSLKKLIEKKAVPEDGGLILDKEKVGTRKHIAITLIDHYGKESEPILVHLD